GPEPVLGTGGGTGRGADDDEGPGPPHAAQPGLSARCITPATVPVRGALGSALAVLGDGSGRRKGTGLAASWAQATRPVARAGAGERVGSSSLNPDCACCT